MSEYTIKPLSTETWDAFARLCEDDARGQDSDQSRSTSAIPRSGCSTLRNRAGFSVTTASWRREHPSLEQVAAACRPVLQAEHDVRVQDGAVLALGDIADQREQLALLRHLDTAVVLGRAVEPADGGVLEGADGGDLRGFQILRAANCVSAATASSPGSHTTT